MPVLGSYPLSSGPSESSFDFWSLSLLDIALLNPHEFLFITVVQEQQLLTDLHGEGLRIYFLCDGSSWPSSTSGDAVRYICILKSFCLQPKVSSSLFYVFKNQTDPGFLHNRLFIFSTQRVRVGTWNSPGSVAPVSSCWFFFFFASLMLHAISPASLVYTRIPLSCLSVWHQVAINLNPQGTAKVKVPAIAPLACFRQRLPSRWSV